MADFAPAVIAAVQKEMHFIADEVEVSHITIKRQRSLLRDNYPGYPGAGQHVEEDHDAIIEFIFQARGMFLPADVDPRLFEYQTGAQAPSCSEETHA